MTLTQLEYIVAVYKFRHFQRAAEACHIGQPTLSMQIKKLEEEIGQVLFDRSKSPIIPTEMGETLAQQAIKVLHEVKQLGDMAQRSALLKGPFKVGIIPGLSPYLMPIFLQDFRRAHPKVELKIEEIQTEVIIQKLKSDELDVGLLSTPLKEAQIIERVLYYEEFVAFLSPKHRLLEKKELAQEDLKEEFLWLLEEGHCLRNQVLKLCAHPRPQGFTFASGSLETIKNLVLSGQYMTVLPEMASASCPKGLLRPFANPAPTREVSLVHVRSFLREKHIEALEKSILDNLPENVLAPKKGRFKILRPY